MSFVWDHKTLIDDLSKHLRGSGGFDGKMVWTDIQLGPSGSPRPDVFTLDKSFAKPKPLAYEVKISRSDFQRDINAGKWMSYLQYAGGVYFCVPVGLLKKTEVPEGAGLMVRGENGWRGLRAAPQSGKLPGFDAMQKLLIKSHDIRRRDDNRDYGRWLQIQKKIHVLYGEDVATAVRDLGEARSAIAHANERRKSIDTEVESIKQRAIYDGRRQVEWESRDFYKTIKEVAVELGLPEDSSARLVINTVVDKLDEGQGRDLNRNHKRLLDLIIRDTKTTLQRLEHMAVEARS